MSDQLLWSLQRGDDEMEAFLRPIAGGLELRFAWNGSTISVRICQDADEVTRIVQAKREELEARGWATER